MCVCVCVCVLVCVSTGALLIYGVLQERIMTIGFGPKLELFENSIFLVLCNRLVTCLVAFACVAFTGTDVKPAAPLMSYCTVSFTNVVSTSCQYEALKYVSFAVQTLAKSAKAFPVMIWGTIYGGKRYRSTEYLHAAAICCGCFVFVMSGNSAARTVRSNEGAMYMVLGGGLMLGYLAVDGLTSTYQDTLFNSYSMSIYDQVSSTHTHTAAGATPCLPGHRVSCCSAGALSSCVLKPCASTCVCVCVCVCVWQVMYTTAFSTLLSFMGAVASGQLLPSVLFVLRHPDALTVILALSASSAVVQLIISYTIKRYGALVFATIMTTRQFFSILLSSVVFWTPLTLWQW